MIFFLFLTVLFLPAYAVRLSFLGLPANLLMVWVFVVWLAFVIYLFLKPRWQEFVGFARQVDNKIIILTGLFFLAGGVSLFVQGFEVKKLGQFIVLFLQPISIFFISSFIINKSPDSRRLILNTLYILLAACGLYAILQYFSLLGLPPLWWGNSVEPKRAIAFWGHPNFYALFSAPLLAFLIPSTFSLPKSGEGLRERLILFLAWLVGAIGLFLSMSRAGWLGLGVAGLIFLFVAADKKVRKLVSVVVIVMVIIIAAVPNLRWRFVLPFYGEKSAVSRLSLWETGWKGVKESPILGLGLTGFANQWPKLNTDPNLDTHNFPHNIFLDLWVETGILGLISLVGLISLLVYRGMTNRADVYKLGVALFLIALLSQGLIDNPYFKNDLAMVFWIILSLYPFSSPADGEDVGRG